MSLKSFGQNAAIYSIGTIALRFTSFLLIPLYTQYLTKSEFGLLQTLLFTIQIIITFNDVGMRTALMRFFSDYEKENNISELLFSSFTLNIFAGILFLIVAAFIPDSSIAIFFNTETIPNLVFLTVLVGVTQTLSITVLSYFRARNEGLKFMFISFGTAILLISSITVALVIYDLGIIGVLYAQAFTFLIVWLAVLLFILFKHGFKINFSTFSKLLKFGFPLIFAMSGDLIVNTSGNYFLGHFRTLEEVGAFALAYKIASISIMVLIGPFQMAYEPYIFSNQDKNDLSETIAKIVTYISLIYVIISYGIIFIFKDLIDLIGQSQYNDSYLLIFLMLPGIGFTVLNYVGQSLIHMNSKTKSTGLIIFVSTAISLVLSYFLTNLYGVYGLIFAINFYIVGSSIALFYFGYKEYPVKLEYKRLFIISLIGIVLFIVVYLLSFESNYLYYSISIFLPIVILFLLYKSNYFTSEEKAVFKKMRLTLLTFFKMKK
ncbi:MAG: polysaccharide biosynthesis protein [Ignavibacteriae bacterium]|nr:polysaccharide biosynthesis protein [Ignavibacteriota bacterium]